MRIPLDYYRILGLPIQATADQLKQAHRDRTLQLPRREYSEIAIEARKQLIDEAYQVLSQEDSRKDYDSKFLAKAYAPDDPDGPIEPAPVPAEVSGDVGEAALRSLASDPALPDPAYTPTIEIDDSQFVGALLILLELGEYELVIRLGRPYLSSGSLSLEKAHLGDPKAALADTVLTLALACLELGREQWQQRQYETAAESLETGHELLVRENLLPVIRAEIQTELYKLRPYRVLELLARPLDQTRERRQGIKLLQGMLQDRGGIEGTDDDLSGLGIDDFLRFIQQLRDYLTASEQQELFEAEARRPSAVATYLTVYALLARGFARHQPALVRRAKQLLMRVAAQQDVHLEQAVCALLLGQTQEASQALELSQEYEPLAFIREHSQGAPDLLPGLCLYAERWLKDEVFPHFRDLREQLTTLKEYFADPQVQAYLEAMPADSPNSNPVSFPQWRQQSRSSTSESAATPTQLGASGQAPPGSMAAGSMPTEQVSQAQPKRGRTAARSAARSAARPDFKPEGLRSLENPFAGLAAAGRMEPSATLADEEGTHGLSVAERVSQLSPEGRLEAATPAKPPAYQNGRGQPTSDSARPAVTALGEDSRQRSARSPRWDRLALLFVAGLLGMGLLGFLTTRTLGLIAGLGGGPKVEGQPLAINVSEPAIEIPAAPTQAEQIGVEEIAERAIQNWLTAKREALGPDHNLDSLKSALAQPALTQWERRAQEAQQSNWYWEYEHTLDIQSVEPNDPTAEVLRATATVTETGRYFEMGIENDSASYTDSLTMQYDLVRQNDEWLVKGMTKVN
ncbi:MAG TPA: IMS domain-containing protein [Trichocoleus sp.]